MANRRMFSKDIVGSDAFLDMPVSSQLLYFHLGMEADDDGFVSSPNRISRTIGGNEDDLKVLLSKRFVLPFPSGIIVIKHWKINNLIQKDRYKETKYLEEKKALITKENGAYTECIQTVNTSEPQVRIGKDRLGKDTIATSVKPKIAKVKKPKKEKTPDQPMNLEAFVAWCAKSPHKHIQLIGEWAETTKPDFRTRDQWQQYIARYVRAAQKLGPFDRDQIERGFKHLNRMREQGKLETYTLETLYKFVTSEKN